MKDLFHTGDRKLSLHCEPHTANINHKWAWPVNLPTHLTHLNMKYLNKIKRHAIATVCLGFENDK